MILYRALKDIIMPVIITYVILCAILAEIVGVYYLYVNYPIAVEIFDCIPVNSSK